MRWPFVGEIRVIALAAVLANEVGGLDIRLAHEELAGGDGNQIHSQLFEEVGPAFAHVPYVCGRPAVEDREAAAARGERRHRERETDNEPKAGNHGIGYSYWDRKASCAFSL